MGGITSGVGLFSGIDSGSIIQQLLAIEARPRSQASARVAQLQLQQTAFLDINSKLGSLRDAARTFRDKKTFQTRTANSSNTDLLTATASTAAASGTYRFIVDRLVSTQQVLSRGFAAASGAAVGSTGFTFESTLARLDKDVNLADLNDGAGVSRGRLAVTDSAGHTATIDLSRATTVSEVLDAINDNGTALVSATIDGGRLLVTDAAGGSGSMIIANATGYTTATSLGIAGSAAAGGTITGSTIYQLGANTTLGTLNDGRGVHIKSAVGVGAAVWNFKIAVGSTDVLVNVGDVYENQTVGGETTTVKVQGAVTTTQGVLDRINTALSAAGFSDVTASIDATNGRLRIVDAQGTRTITVSENTTLGSSTAADLGILGGSSPTLNGRRVFAGLNTTLVRGLSGGTGVGGDGVLDFILHDGSSFSLTIDTSDSTLAGIMRQIETASAATPGGAKRVAVSLDARGTGLTLTDLTTGGNNFTITGTGGNDTAEALGISTGGAGASGATVSSGNLQRAYLSNATLVSSLNNGRGIGTGTFRLTDAMGNVGTVNIDASVVTVADLITKINNPVLGQGGTALRVKARINATGDGIEVYEDLAQGPAGTQRIKIEDASGSVARSLNLAGTATGTGASNYLNGSYERTVAFLASDSLEQIAAKINGAGVGVAASVVRDGNGATPYRLSLSSTGTGTAGRFVLDTGAFDLGATTLDAGHDARVFFGATDPARALAVTSSTNTVDTLLPGVKIDLVNSGSEPVTLSVTTDTAAITDAVNKFISAFNTLVERIDSQSRYDATAQRGGPLVGDGTMIELRAMAFRTVQAPGVGTTGRYDTLAQVGVRVGRGGKLELNEDLFRQALQEDPAGVESLFAARTLADDTVQETGFEGITVRNPFTGNTYTSLGVMGQFEEFVERYVDSVSGILTGRSKGLDDQIKLQQDRIAQMTAKLEQRRGILERQFQAMETAISKLQTQQSALGSISRIG